MTPHETRDPLDEMNEALAVGAFFNPEMFGAMLRKGDDPVLRWRDALAAERTSHAAALAAKDEEIAGLKREYAWQRYHRAQADAELAALRAEVEDLKTQRDDAAAAGLDAAVIVVRRLGKALDAVDCDEHDRKLVSTACFELEAELTGVAERAGVLSNLQTVQQLRAEVERLKATGESFQRYIEKQRTELPALLARSHAAGRQTADAEIAHLKARERDALREGFMARARGGQMVAPGLPWDFSGQNDAGDEKAFAAYLASRQEQPK